MSKEVFHKFRRKCVRFMEKNRREEHMEKRKSKNRALSGWLEMAAEVMEILIAVIVLAGFIFSIVPLVREIPSLLTGADKEAFHTFLESAFNLVIGIEFIRMLIKHTPGSALEVLMFALARHMVFDSGSGIELLCGVAAIAGIFAVRKYLYVHSFESKDDECAFEFIKLENEKTGDEAPQKS